MKDNDINEEKSLVSVNTRSLPYRIKLTATQYKEYLKFLRNVLGPNKDKEIIEKVAYIQQYGVLNYEAFRFVAADIIKANPNSTLIMCDVNNLYMANKMRNKEQVNLMLAKMVDDMKNILKSNGIEEEKIDLNKQKKENIEKKEDSSFLIGKMGDEFYIVVKNKKEYEISDIIEKTRQIKNGELSMSVGACDDFSKGISNAFDQADKIMCIDKKKFKSQNLMEYCNGNIDKLIDQVIKIQFDKARIDTKILKSNQKGLDAIRNTYDQSMENIDFNKLYEEVRSCKYDGGQENSGKDEFDDKVKNYEDESREKGINQKNKKTYVLGQILSRHFVAGVKPSEFFQKIGYKNMIKKIKNDRENKSTKVDILATDLSGLKRINDNLGHSAGDLAIEDSLKYIKSVLNDMDIKDYSSIIAKRGGNSYVIMENLTNEQRNELLVRLQQYGIDDFEQKKVTMLCDIRSIDKKELLQSKFKPIDVINDKLTSMEKTLGMASLSRKITDVRNMEHVIKSIYRQVLGSAMIDDLRNIDQSKIDIIDKKIRTQLEKEFQENNISEKEVEQKTIEDNSHKIEKNYKEK
ncbi:MAG: GGDEF domain-containing protein [Clostridia bacterium]|nr:GGDEF domain-containing protein [Clostridia bacterium]